MVVEVGTVSLLGGEVVEGVSMGGGAYSQPSTDGTISPDPKKYECIIRIVSTF